MYFIKKPSLLIVCYQHVIIGQPLDAVLNLVTDRDDPAQMQNREKNHKSRVLKDGPNTRNLIDDPNASVGW